MLEWLKNMFDFASGSGLDVGTGLVNDQGTADLSNSWFKENYAVIWGLAVIVSAIVGAIAALIAAAGSSQHVGSVMNTGRKMFFFAENLVVGMLIPVVYAMGLALSKLVSQLIMSVPAAADHTSWADRLSNFLSAISDPIFTGNMTAINGILLFVMEFVVVALKYGPYAIGLILPLSHAFIPMSRHGGIWPVTLRFAWVTIASKPAMLVVLMIGNGIANQPNTGDHQAAIVSTIAMMFAVFVPFMMFAVFPKKTSAIITSFVPTLPPPESRSENTRRGVVAVTTAGMAIVARNALQERGKATGGPSVTNVIAQQALLKAAAKSGGTPQGFAVASTVALASAAASKAAKRGTN